MGGGSEREREWLGEMINNKMPVFRNISPLASAFGWSFLPPNYISIKYHLVLDTSTKNQLLKSVLSFEGGESIGLQGAVHERLGVPCIMDILYVAHQSLWGSWWHSAEVRCALGMIRAVLSGQGSWTCSSVSRCWELPAAVPLWGPKYAIFLCTHCRALRPVVGWTDSLMGAFRFLAWEPELWRLLPNVHFWFTSATFSPGKVFSGQRQWEPKGVLVSLALLWLCVWGENLTTCQSSEAILAGLPAGDSKQIYHTTYFLSQKGIVWVAKYLVFWAPKTFICLCLQTSWQACSCLLIF